MKNEGSTAAATLELPAEILQATHMTTAELKLELALALFQQSKLSFGKARELAGLSVVEFQRELGRRKIPIHYDTADFEQDIATLKTAGLL